MHTSLQGATISVGTDQFGLLMDISDSMSLYSHKTRAQPLQKEASCFFVRSGPALERSRARDTIGPTRGYQDRTQVPAKCV